MRRGHELEKGIICERCKRIFYKGNYISIKYLEPILEDNTGRYKTINRHNLCKKCYSEYEYIIHEFIKSMDKPLVFNKNKYLSNN